MGKKEVQWTFMSNTFRLRNASGWTKFSLPCIPSWYTHSFPNCWHSEWGGSVICTPLEHTCRSEKSAEDSVCQPVANLKLKIKKLVWNWCCTAFLSDTLHSFASLRCFYYRRLEVCNEAVRLKHLLSNVEHGIGKGSPSYSEGLYTTIGPLNMHLWLLLISNFQPQ